MSIRTEKVARMIQREIADLLQNQFAAVAEVFLTVTDVRMTPDLSIAYINLSVLGTDAEKQDAIQRLDTVKVAIRKALASRIRHQMRHIPNLKFFSDEAQEQVAKMEDLFAQIRKEREENPSIDE